MFYIGTILDIIVFGSILMLIKNFNQLLNLKKKKLDEISVYLNSIELTEDFKNEITEYNEVLWWKNRKKFLDSSLLKDLNECLKVRLSILEHKDKLFSVCHFIENFSQSFFIKFSKKLKFDFFLTNDILIFEGDIERKIYFIPRLGKVSIKINGNIVRSLKEGEFFGEISAFLKTRRRTASVITLCSSNYFYIEDKPLMNLLYDFPFEAKLFYKVCYERFKNTVDLMSFELKNKLGYFTKNPLYKSDFNKRFKRQVTFDKIKTDPYENLFKEKFPKKNLNNKGFTDEGNNCFFNEIDNNANKNKRKKNIKMRSLNEVKNLEKINSIKKIEIEKQMEKNLNSFKKKEVQDNLLKNMFQDCNINYPKNILFENNNHPNEVNETEKISFKLNSINYKNLDFGENSLSKKSFNSSFYDNLTIETNEKANLKNELKNFEFKEDKNHIDNNNNYTETSTNNLEIDSDEKEIKSINSIIAINSIWNDELICLFSNLKGDFKSSI